MFRRFSLFCALVLSLIVLSGCKRIEFNKLSSANRTQIETILSEVMGDQTLTIDVEGDSCIDALRGSYISCDAPNYTYLYLNSFNFNFTRIENLVGFRLGSGPFTQKLAIFKTANLSDKCKLNSISMEVAELSGSTEKDFPGIKSITLVNPKGASSFHRLRGNERPPLSLSASNPESDALVGSLFTKLQIYIDEENLCK